jgi:hypothetical protein
MRTSSASKTRSGSFQICSWQQYVLPQFRKPRAEVHVQLEVGESGDAGFVDDLSSFCSLKNVASLHFNREYAELLRTARRCRWQSTEPAPEAATINKSAAIQNINALLRFGSHMVFQSVVASTPKNPTDAPTHAPMQRSRAALASLFSPSHNN